MRLTLRTLLAYLDDVLDPSQTREIGQKIRESPRAAALVSRIREAIRRRRLGAPDLEGPAQGVDPNVVACYLDDSLTPEQVVEFEQICLESDVQLAEVAACHQILTLVWSEGRELPQSSLDRFYALGPVPFDERLQTDDGASPAVVAVKSTATEGATPTAPQIPDYLKPGPWTHRVGPLAGVALIVVIAALLLAPDRDLFRGLSRREVSRAPAVNVLLPSDELPPSRPPSPRQGGEAAVAAAPAAAPVSPMPSDAVSAVAALPRGIDPAPPPDAPEPMPTTPAASASATPMPAVTKADASPPSPPAPTPPAPMPRVPVQYTSVEGTLLRFEPDDGLWYVQPRRSEVQPDELFASPDPFESQFDFDRGAFRVTLLSESVLKVLPSTETARRVIRIDRGRVVLQPGAKGGPEPLDMTIVVGEQRWLLRFANPETVAGVEVMLREAAGFEKVWGSDNCRAVLSVGLGVVQIDPDTDKTESVAAGQRHVLVAGPAPATASGEVSLLWLDPQLRDRGDTLRRFGARFEKQFDPTIAVNLAIPAVTKDPNPKMAELAARCLNVIGSYVDLVQTLAESEHEEARNAAAQGLRVWLPQSKENGERLQRELARYYVKDEADVAYRLLWGFTPEDAKNKVISVQLVELLRSPRIEFRELAFYQLVQLTGRRYDYRPLESQSKRELAIQRWMGHLQREGGSLVRGE